MKKYYVYIYSVPIISCDLNFIPKQNEPEYNKSVPKKANIGPTKAGGGGVRSYVVRKEGH